MHKIPVGRKVKVLVDNPFRAGLYKGDIVMVAGHKITGSYYVTDTDLIFKSPYWSVAERHITPVIVMEENE